MTTQAAPARRPPRENRMTLDRVRGSRSAAPDRIVVYGVEGIGKSTWGASAPSPVFIAPEDGVKHLDVKVFPEPQSLGDVYDAIRTLETTEHGFKTLVVDSADWLEPLVWSEVCGANGWDSIERPEFQKGYFAAAMEWRRVIQALDRLRAAKGMEVVVVAHSEAKPHNNPLGKDYSRYQMKLDKRAAAVLREWADVVLFAIFEDYAEKQKGDVRVKATTSGRRIVHTQRSAAFDAKNRLNLPPTLALSYGEFDAARKRGQPADPKELAAEAGRLVAAIGDEDLAVKVNLAVDVAKGDAVQLARIVDRLRTRVVEKEGSAA